MLNPINQGRPFGSGAAGVPPHEQEVFSSRLALPLSCDHLDQPPSSEVREATERTNAAVLSFLLQGVDLEAMPRPADERVAEALAPVRIKLDMIIDLLARVSYREIELPPLCDVELGSTQIAWRSQQRLVCEGWLRILLYFDVKFREAIVLFGKVASCIEQGRDRGCRVAVDLIEMPGAVSDGLARLALVTQRHQRARHPVRAAVGREA